MNDTETPLMRQYRSVKEKYSDEILFFRLGDFYEMFDDDAVKASKILGLVLTHRITSPMCGIPYHASKNYIKRLLDAGERVAICEQLSVPEKSNELASRDVVAVFTPGTVIDDEFMDSTSQSFVLSAFPYGKKMYLSWCDISAGIFRIKTVEEEDAYSEIHSIGVREIIVPDDIYYSDNSFRDSLKSIETMVTPVPLAYFTDRNGKKMLRELFSDNALRIFGISDNDKILSPIGALISYIKQTRPGNIPELGNVERMDGRQYLYLDDDAISNLELLPGVGRSLFECINRTVTASGARFLKDAIIHPLRDITKINDRLDWVSFYVSDRNERERVRTLLSECSDMERLSRKASIGSLNPRNIISIADSITSFFSIINGNDRYGETVSGIKDSFDDLIGFRDKAISAVNRNCTNIDKIGTIILPFFSAELDRERSIAEDGNILLSEYTQKIKSETGIQTLKVSENRIIGVYLEIPKTNSHLVPESFKRVQTLVSSERYTTDELEDIQRRRAEAESVFASHERAILNSIIDEAGKITKSFVKVGEILRNLDFYSSLAKLADEECYTRPVMSENPGMEIVNGRHPVVESFIGRATYVPNSFSTEKARLALVTGPNMAGKSTYLREIALITLMAHMGSFVPAESALIPVSDRVFCRVGASDDISRGASTFLVEMSETASILRNATERSLVIVDEIGRGTSTEDGMSIAYAVMERLKEIGSVTLFATHYHELTRTGSEGVQFIRMAISESGNNVYFLRKAEEGVSSSSYGIFVARLAGVPAAVIRKAEDFRKKHFSSYICDLSERDLFSNNETNQIDEIMDLIESFDENRSTPLEALMLISELKKKNGGKSDAH